MRDSFKGRLKMFCRLLILVFISSLFWIPTASPCGVSCDESFRKAEYIPFKNTFILALDVLHKRGASFYIANETMCIVDGDVYRNGDPVPTDDECERCTCRPPGFSCVLRDCDNKPGCKAVRRAGECCPEYVCGCVHNSRLYEDGELIKDLQNNCYTCRCHGSSISCTFAECGFRSDCPPEYIPGECCPRYDHCPPAIPMTTTTTTTASPTLIQQEIDFFNLTSQHVQKFTTESSTVKIEEVTTSAFTTPSPMYTIKFSLSGEKISSIQDFDGAELTTLLPLQSVTYKETTRHVVVPKDTELTTLKDGLIIASFDKTTEIPSTLESQRETDHKIPLQTTTDASILSIKTATDNIDDTSSKVSITENNVITVLSEDVSDWDDGVKTEQEAEPSISESDSEENNIDFTEVELVTDEITQQESSRATTIVPISNHTLESTLSNTYENVHEVISTTEHSKIISHEKIQTESTTGFKPVTDLLSTTTIDDETVTRKVTDLFDDNIESSLDELPIVGNVSSAQPSESTAAGLEKLDKISVHTEHDNDFTSLITNRVQSSTDEIPHFDSEEEIDTASKTTDSSEEIHFTTSDNLITAIDNAQKTTESYQHGEILNTSSYSEEYSISAEIATAQGIDATSHSLDDVSEETSHHHVDSSEQAEMITDIAQTQTSISLSASNDSDEFFSTYQTTVEKETSGHSQSTDKQYESSVDDLLSTSHYLKSTSTNISPTTDGSSKENFNSLDAETTAYPEHDKATDSDNSVESTGSTLESIVKGITSLFSTSVDADKYSITTATDLEDIHISSTEHPINDSMHISVIDKNYDSGIDFEVTKYDADKDTGKVFEIDESLNKTDFGLASVGEDEEREAESEEITTQLLSGQTSSDHITHEETLHSEDPEINVYTEQTKEDETTIKTTIIEEKESTGILNNVDYGATHDVLHTEYTTVKSIISSAPSFTDVSHPGEAFSVTKITNYTTENFTDSFKVTESGTKENASEHLISKTDSTADDLIATPKTDELTSQPQTTSEVLSETTIYQTVIGDKKEEIIPVKQHVEVSATRDTVITQTPVFVETTFKIQTTEKISTTTEDDMPNELPAFEPPLANILKQHMLFNRPVSHTVTSNTEANPSKDTSEENEIEKLPLTVDENSLDSSDLDESGNKIISFNQEYTIQDSETLSTADKPNNEESETSGENRDNLYFVKTEYDSVTEISNKDRMSTQVTYNGQTTPKIEDLSHNQNHDDNEESTSNIEIMDSEELHSEIISKESNSENILTNTSVVTSLYETNNDVNLSTSDKENSNGLAETTIYFVNNAETSSIFQEDSHSVSDETNDSAVENTSIESLFPDLSTVADTITQGHLNENFELNTNADNIDPLDELDSDFVYEDAESSENFNDTIQTSTPVEELQTHLITYHQYVTSSSLSDKDKTLTESRPISSGLNYTSLTSDSAKEEYLAAIKFSTLYEQKFFTTPQQYQTFASASSGIQNVLNSTINSDIDAVENKRTSDSSELTQYESLLKKQQTYGYSEEHSASAEDSKNIPELDSSLIIASTEDENLSVSNEHSTNSNRFNSLFSTLEGGSSTDQDIAEVTTQSNTELLIDQIELGNSSLNTASTKIGNLTKSSDQDYSSRLKNEFAEYGVLGGVFVTGKSKYQVNTTNEHDKNPNSAEFLNAIVEQELNPTVENRNIVFHNHSDNLEVENDAEEDYSATYSDLNTRYASTTVLKTEEEIESDNDATKNENQESLDKDVIGVNLSTVMPSDEMKLEETSNSEASPEISTTFMDLTSDVSSDETLSATKAIMEISEVLSTSQTDSEESDDDAFLTKVEIQQEKGPEKGGDWFEPTDPNSVLPSVEKQGNVSDAMSQFDTSDVVSDVTTESHAEHGPEKGGDVFEPTFPDLFPINNENSNIESDTTNSGSQISSTKITDLSSEETFNKNVTSITSPVTESKSNSDTSTESNMKLDFVPPLPILLRSFPKLTQSSNGSINGSENIETVNNDEISKLDLNQNYMSDEGNVELPPKRPSERNLDPSYDLSDVISKVFKSPGYDSEVHLRSLKDYSDLKKTQSLRLKRNANDKSETSENIQSDSVQNNKNASERNPNPSYDLNGIPKVSKVPGYDAEVHLVSLKGHPDLKKDQYLRLKRDANIHSEDIQPDSELPAGSAEKVYLFDNKNILLVEGYGQKPGGFVPVTSSLIIVHSDDENETEVDSKQNKSGNESKDISVSEFLDEVMSTSPEKEDASSDLSKRHPKV